MKWEGGSHVGYLAIMQQDAITFPFFDSVTISSNIGVRYLIAWLLDLWNYKTNCKQIWNCFYNGTTVSCAWSEWLNSSCQLRKALGVLRERFIPHFWDLTDGALTTTSLIWSACIIPWQTKLERRRFAKALLFSSSDNCIRPTCKQPEMERCV